MRMRVVLVMVLGLLAGAPVAHAGTVALSNTEHCECDDEGGTDQLTHILVWTGAAGEANTVEVSFAANAFRVTDTTAPVTAGDGCRQVNAGEASCTTPATCPGGRGISCFDAYDVRLDGGDADDTLTAGSLPVPSEGIRDTTVAFEGRDGNDTLNGGALEDTLLGGNGRDVLNGGGGDDSLLPDGANLVHPDASATAADAAPPFDADTIDGGPGSDTVSYDEHTMPVTVDLAAGSGGELGEGDRLSGVENVIGGSGENTLSGDDAANDLTGGPSTDHLDGRGGDDRLDGQGGSDELHGGPGADDLRGDGVASLGSPPAAASDTLDGGDGPDTASWMDRPGGVTVDLSNPAPDGEAAAPDTLVSIENVTGTTGNDVLTGDAGANVLQGDSGADRIAGGAGDDTVLADGVRDKLGGGPGNDFIADARSGVSCGPGRDTVSEARSPLRRDCETIAFMPEFWSATLGPPPPALLLMLNRPARTTRTAAFVRLACPAGARCRGTLELITQQPSRRLGRTRVALLASRSKTVRIKLTKTGRRFVTRRARSKVTVRFAKRVAPLVLRRAR